jgi:hypothetical protein
MGLFPLMNLGADGLSAARPQPFRDLGNRQPGFFSQPRCEGQLGRIGLGPQAYHEARMRALTSDQTAVSSGCWR